MPARVALWWAQAPTRGEAERSGDSPASSRTRIQPRASAARPGQERRSWRPTRSLAREGGRGLMSRLSPPHRYSSGGCCGTRVTGSAGKGTRMQAKSPQRVPLASARDR
jgi:hypothetical protein